MYKIFVFVLLFPFFAAAQTGQTVFDQPVPGSKEAEVYEIYSAKAQKGGQLTRLVSTPIDLIYPHPYRSGLPHNSFNGAHTLYESLFYTTGSSGRTIRAFLASEYWLEGKKLFVRLNPDVRFWDGSPVTPQDVIQSAEILFEAYGQSLMKSLVGEPNLQVIDERTISADMSKAPDLNNGILKLLGNIYVIKPMTAPFEVPGVPMKFMGTGPYVPEHLGRDRITLKRHGKYWAEAHPLRKGRMNFDRLSYLVYRDDTARMEAFTAGDGHIYEARKIRDQEILKQKVRPPITEVKIDYVPTDKDQAAIFINTDPSRPGSQLAFRQALTLAYDFDTINSSYNGGRMSRLPAIGDLGPLAPRGRMSAEMENVLKELSIDVGDDLKGDYDSMGFKPLYRPASRRERLSRASALLKNNGFVIDGGKLKWKGEQVVLRFLLRPGTTPAGIHAYVAELKVLGIDASLVSAVDAVGFVSDMDNKRYDLIESIVASVNREVEAVDSSYLRQDFHSSHAGIGKGTSNRANIRDPHLDKIIEMFTTIQPSDKRFPALVNVLLRKLSSLVPVILIGEPASYSVYAHPGYCVPTIPATAEVFAFFSKDGCPAIP